MRAGERDGQQEAFVVQWGVEGGEWHGATGFQVGMHMNNGRYEW